MQIIPCIVHRIGKGEIIIRPFQLFAEGNGDPEVLQRVAVAEGIGIGAEIIPAGPEYASVETEGQRITLLSSQPGFGEREVVGLVGFTVGLYAQT